MRLGFVHKNIEVLRDFWIACLHVGLIGHVDEIESRFMREEVIKGLRQRYRYTGWVVRKWTNKK